MKRLYSSFKWRFLLYTSWCFQKLLRYIVPINPKVIVFLPRGGGMTVDRYDYFNYTSDNALALMHYMVGKYGNNFIYRLACDANQFDELHQKLSGIKDVDIDCFPCFSYEKPYSLKRIVPMLRAKYIFMSEVIPVYTKKRRQKAVFLNYFVPFKDDYGYRFLPLQSFEELIDYSITTSLLSSYIISTVYNISLSKCIALGFSRNDCLLTVNDNKNLDDFINNSVDYKVKKVLLYTPTHRDYERGKTDERKLLGFDVDYKKLDTILRENNAIIVCKIHSAQNKNAIDFQLPQGIVLYPSNTSFTLCELMQRADCMITDYTSTYFDYLLLNRPVLFNFYDYDIYKKSRGFSYDPLEPFLAGDIFYDEKSFFESINGFFSGNDRYKEKRQIIRDIHHKYKDSKTSERICNLFFEK